MRTFIAVCSIWLRCTIRLLATLAAVDNRPPSSIAVPSASTSERGVRGRYAYLSPRSLPAFDAHRPSADRPYYPRKIQCTYRVSRFERNGHRNQAAYRSIRSAFRTVCCFCVEAIVDSTSQPPRVRLSTLKSTTAYGTRYPLCVIAARRLGFCARVSHKDLLLQAGPQIRQLGAAVQNLSKPPHALMRWDQCRLSAPTLPADSSCAWRRHSLPRLPRSRGCGSVHHHRVTSHHNPHP